MTREVQEILSHNQAIWKDLPDTHPSLRSFLYSLHDWWHYPLGGPFLWQEYDTNLVQIATKAAKLTQTQRQWVRLIGEQPSTGTTLLYRHYLYKQALAKEASVDPDFDCFFCVLLCSLPHDIGFSTLPHPQFWKGINTNTHPVNVLRERRTVLKDYLTHLANREDVHHARTQRDHHLLTSCCFLYGLHLAQVILRYQTQLHPHPLTDQFTHFTHLTISKLEGVFFHEQEQHLLPYV